MTTDTGGLDLSTCEREPIHIPGRVQSHGILLEVEDDGGRVVSVSANTKALSTRPPTTWLDRPLCELVPREAASAVERALAAPGATTGNPRQVHYGDCGLDRPAYATVHHHLNRAIVELEPEGVGPTSAHPNELIGATNAILLELRRAPSLDAFTDCLARSVRKLLGYDRVMIYRFSDDWHGWVDAECRRDDLEPFLGLHYPATDIPSQARRLFLLNRVRLISDVDANQAELLRSPSHPDREPLDMTHAALRGVSPIHIEYLQNMGVHASLTLALEHRGELWGMIACHHYASACHLDVSLRATAELVARGAEMRASELIFEGERRTRSQAIVHQRAIADDLARDEDLARGLDACRDHLLPLVGADGFAAWIDGRAVVEQGRVPDDRLLTTIVDHLQARGRESVHATRHLSAELADAVGQEVLVSGLLAVPLSATEDAWLMWFRGELRRTVNWAGSPHKPAEAGPDGMRLSPRKSFALWQESVTGQSKPWSSVDVEAAELLRTTLSDVVFRERERLLALTEELTARNADLESFAAMASHDLREPLRGIGNYARFLREDLARGEGDDVDDHLDSLDRLVGRMYTLIEGLLLFARYGADAVELERVELDPLVEEVVEAHQALISERAARITIEPLPAVTGWALGLREVFANLLTNALKYSEGAPEVTIGVASRDDAHADANHVIRVADRGVGIAPENQTKIFEMFHRLHRDDRYGPGTGLGLPIVRKLTERMGGRVWLESELGEGSAFFLSLPPAGHQAGS